MRFSLRWLFVAVAFVAISVVALLNANLYWAGLARTGLIVFLASAIVGGINSRGEKRAFWFGVAIVGWIYRATAIVNCYWFASDVLSEQLSRAMWDVLDKPQVGAEEHVFGERVLADGRTFTNRIEHVPLEKSFHLVNKCILNALFAMLGGLIATWFYRRNHRSA
jgi:hypothetical protein